MQQCIKIYYSIFIWSWTCFGRHTAHHQGPKTALAASGLHTWKVVGRVVAGRCQLSADSVQQPHVQQPSTYAKPEAASAVLGSWWWAVCSPKHIELHIHGIINFWYTVASCWIFLHERMEKFIWTDHEKNVEEWQRVKEDRNILSAVKRRKTKWTGHILRRICLLKHVIEGKRGRSDGKTRKKT